MRINDALKQIKRLGTNGCNCDISNKDILNKVQAWDKMLELEVLEITHDSVTIHFKSLPTDTKEFAEELYKFCPDIVDQHFGCFDEILTEMEEAEQNIPEHLKTLVEGIDFSSERYGLDLLEKSLKEDGRIQLWWD